MKSIVFTILAVCGLFGMASDGVSQELKIADCPVAVASFGAAVSDGYLYMYGGNAGPAHSFSMEDQNHVFRRIKLENGAQWESLGEVPRRQGNALVAYQNKLYQVGGFETKNKQGEDQDLHSSRDFKVYDPATKKWTELTKLPEPRSSFDAVVLGDDLFVVGGWALNGKEKDPVWHETAWKIDLSDANAKWQPIKNPNMVRRANSVSHFQGKIYEIGGMGEDGGPTTEVAVYDPAKDSWSEGPELPGEPMDGFGNSAFNVDDNLIVSTFSGQVLRLKPNGSGWEKIKQLDSGRFFHRMVPIDDHQVVILCGASQDTGKENSVLVVDIGSSKDPSNKQATEGSGKAPAGDDVQYDADLAEQLGADEYGMRSYVLVVLKTGQAEIEDPAESRKVFAGHFANMKRLANEKKLVLAGPLMDGAPKRGIYIFNVTTLEQAEQLVKTDPAVQAGVFDYELTKLYCSAALMKLGEIHSTIQKSKIE